MVANDTPGAEPYVFVQDVAASWTEYERVRAQLLEPAPEGLLVHVAGPTEEGFRVIAVWTSEAAWRNFDKERLQPAIAALGGPHVPQPRFRDLHPTHIVLGRPRGQADKLSDQRQQGP